MEGHEILGFFFFAIGLWHLFNHIKLNALCPKSYKSTLWFPTPKCRYFELHSIIVSTTMFIAMELFISPDRHQPFDTDGTIPSNHLHNFEHSLMASAFLAYAALTIVLDRKLGSKSAYELTHFLAAMAFSQQFLLIHLHSRDHMGPEGQYHYLLQLVIAVSLSTTLMGIGFPNSFMVSFVRSVSIIFQGVWLMVMGFMLWTPGYQAKGCFLRLDGDQFMVRCNDDKALHRAVSLVNIQFSWLLIVVTVFALCFYLIVSRSYAEKVEYVSLGKDEQEYGSSDIESQSSKNKCMQNANLI